MSLLPEGMCWMVRAKDVVLSDVSGEAVIGKVICHVFMHSIFVGSLGAQFGDSHRCPSIHSIRSGLGKPVILLIFVLDRTCFLFTEYLV